MIYYHKQPFAAIQKLAAFLGISALALSTGCGNSEAPSQAPVTSPYPETTQHENTDQPSPQRTDPKTISGYEPLDILQTKISDFMGRDMSVKTERVSQYENWLLICGTPREADLSPANYYDSPLLEDVSKGLVEDRFCALFKKETSYHTLVEFDIGSTDSPVMGWIEIYDLPRELLKAQKIDDD